MNDTGVNIYRFAREKAKLTREKASELLDISYKQLGNYEKYCKAIGLGLPPDLMVIRMAVVYQAPWLLVSHLWENNEIVQLIFKDCDIVDDLALSILIEQKEMEDVKNTIPGMIEALRDGKLDHNDESVTNNFVKESLEAGFILIAGAFSQKIEKHPLVTGAVLNV